MLSAPIAQRTEHQSPEPRVVGSKPAPATKKDEANPIGFAFSFTPEKSYNNGKEVYYDL